MDLCVNCKRKLYKHHTYIINEIMSNRERNSVLASGLHINVFTDKAVSTQTYTPMLTTYCEKTDRRN